MTKMGFFSRILAVYCVFEAGRTVSVTSKERDKKILANANFGLEYSKEEYRMK
jgi:hypothetical protein